MKAHSYSADLPSRLDALADYLTDGSGTKPMPDDCNIPALLREASLALRAGPGDSVTKALANKLNEADAERYRFLKARRGNIVEIAWNSFYSDIYATAKMGNVDAAIDKAMEAARPATASSGT